MATTWIRLTARVVSRAMPSLVDDEVGLWMWQHLHAAFPAAVAAVLMPEHTRLLLPGRDLVGSQRRLSRLVGQAARVFGGRGQASLVADPMPVPTAALLHRHVRALAREPSRAAHHHCPLRWMWTTHRDVVGATMNPWITADRLARAVERADADFVARHHAYVSADARARAGATPLPCPAAPTEIARIPLYTIAAAACASLRRPPTAVAHDRNARDLFVALALEQGWRNSKQLASACGCSVRTIERLRATGVPVSTAARLCLGDARLHGCQP